MGRRKGIPKLRLHKASGQGYVEIDGHSIYFGAYDTPESRLKYHAFIAEWMANGKRNPRIRDGLSILELSDRYVEYCRTYYPAKNGKPPTEYEHILLALRALLALYADLPAAEFDSLKLETVQESLIAKRLSRHTVNRRIRLIKTMYKWAAKKLLVPIAVYQLLCTVEGLRKGRSTAKESEPVRPVAEAYIEAVLPLVAAPVRDMIRIQLLCACRPGEIVGLRSTDIDRSGKVWTAELRSHKTAHHGKRRVLYFGPKAQEILQRRLLAAPVGGYLFPPTEYLTERAERAQAQRRPGQKPTPRISDRTLGDCYTVSSYRRAIHRACERAGIPAWSPNQLRHTAATRIRKEFSLDAAQVLLGHSSAAITQVYAEVDSSKALDVIERLG